jgi:site-specific recombinase XerD
MANVIFRLRKNGLDKNKQPKTEPVAIQVYYYHEGVEVELSTGLSVLPSQFVGARVADHPQGKHYNKVLSELESQLYNVHVHHRNKSKLEHEAIVRELIKGEAPQKKTVVEWIQEFIVNAPVKDKTKQVYRVSLNHLIDYVSKERIALSWESFNLEFYAGFTAHLYGIPHSDNTVGKTIKTLKTFISNAFERDLHTNLSFKKKGFKVISSEVDEIYLDEKEIRKIHELKGLEPHLEESKKRFVFYCCVGLRFGDANGINPNNITTAIDGGYRLKVTTEKTGEDVIIALDPLAEEIWNAWGCRPPKKISNPKFNKHIKTIAEKAGLTELVQKRTTVKGKVSIEWVHKWEMVKAHTCRRSFATNSYLDGVPTQTIMAMTGHKTEKSFKKYIRITKEQHADIHAEHIKKQQGETVMKKAN